MKKEKIKNILLIVIVALVTSFVTAYGVSSTFDSSNVCYKVDSNTGASVQDTIDDLYGRASDYSELKSYFKNNPTSYFDEAWLNLNGNNVNPGVRLLYNNVSRGGFYYASSKNTTYLSANDSNGTSGQGTLGLIGNPVTINGIDVSNDSSGTPTIDTTRARKGNDNPIKWYKIGRIVIVYLYDIAPYNITSDGTFAFASGLPKASNPITGNILTSDNKAYRVAISGTKLEWNWNHKTFGTNEGYAMGFLVYISSE